MFCPKCGAEYRDGFRECTSCRTQLVEQPVDPPTPVTGDWSVLAEHETAQSFGANLDLLFVEAVLRDEGIDTAFEPVRPGEEFGLAYAPVPHVRLLVPTPDLERAKQILADLVASQPEVPDETGDFTDDEWQEGAADGEPEGAPGDAPRLSFQPPPVDKAIQPGCVVVLVALGAAMGSLALVGASLTLALLAN